MEYKIVFHNRSYTSWTFDPPMEWSGSVQGFFSGDILVKKADSSPLNSSQLNSSPLNSSPLNSSPLNSSQLNSSPLNSSQSNSSPLNSSQSNSLTAISSPVSSGVVLTGVLMLSGNGFGRDAKGRLLFPCIPERRDLPPFMVPYNVKVGFHKKKVNKYVLFSFVEWPAGGRPIGVLKQALGDVSDLNAYYDYLLYSGGFFQNKAWSKLFRFTPEFILTTSPTATFFSKQALEGVCLGSGGEGEIETVFTIDSAGTVDFDDAFRFTTLSNERTMVSVYITNVADCIHSIRQQTLSSTWEKVLSGPSTIYMPHRRIPMLLDVLTDHLSLREGCERNCVVVRFVYVKGGSLESCSFDRVRVWVEKNWTYSEFSSQKGDNPLMTFTRSLCEEVMTPSDLVAYWMVQYNRFMGRLCLERKDGIFRNGLGRKQDMVTMLMENKEEDVLGVCQTGYSLGYQGTAEPYLPTTNPLRRQVDLINQYSLVYGPDSWGVDLDIEAMNRDLKRVSKIQRESRLLSVIARDWKEGGEEKGKAGEEEEKGPNRLFYGVVYQVHHQPLKNVWCYSVFLKDVAGHGEGLFSQFKREEEIEQDLPFMGEFQLFYFKDDHDLKQKIRVSFIQPFRQV